MSTQNNWFFAYDINELISLASLDYLAPITVQKLYTNFTSFSHVCRADKEELISTGISPSQAKLILERPKDTTRQQQLLDSLGIKLVLITDVNYPKLLKEINDPPLWLFYKGDLSSLSSRCITIVGTREPSEYGINALLSVVSPQLAKDITIVSGLAYGIDKQAHLHSLNNGGKTVAVLAGGLDNIYPREHTELAKNIVSAGGAIISEYPPLSRPLPHRFPQRNRILSGLSMLTLVVEANIKSGTLTTARSAIDYNRDLAAIPADITRPQAEGPNFLIANGAEAIFNSSQLDTYFSIH